MDKKSLHSKVGFAANIFSQIPENMIEEFAETLFAEPALKIERIISRGHSSPPGFWYDQDFREWVILLKGSAGIRLEDNDRILQLFPGDYLDIPPHCKHRVEWTDTETDTMWLAIHHFSGKES